VTFARTAAEPGVAYTGIDFEAEFKIDIRGRLGNRNVRPHFHTVRVAAYVDTEASESELAAVVEETERRCPSSISSATPACGCTCAGSGARE
jgi:hypothetical protein